MTRKQLLEELEKLTKSKDPESAHRVADKLLLNYINDIEVKRLWEKIPKYY